MAKTENTISDTTFGLYGKELLDVNLIFGEMWRTQGRMVFSKEYDTAALEIVDGKFRISFNKNYWSKLKKKERLFVICHEYMHVILGHWLNPGIENEWLNIAQDIQVNEYLISNTHLQVPSDDFCTIDSVFKDKAYKVELKREYQYYYGLIMKCLPDSEKR